LRAVVAAVTIAGMPDENIAEAAHAHARAVVANDIGATVRSMTPDGLAKAMDVGNTTWEYRSYELTSTAEDGDDYLVVITYETDMGPMRLRDRFRLIDGAWKVVDVERLDD
jgi:hypothetical protein